MKVVGPFRPTDGVVDLAVNGKRRTRVGYGKKVKVTGSLLTELGGRPVANVPIQLTETFQPGVKRPIRSKVVTTNGQGGFSAKLKAGPSRQITVAYKGDRRYLGTTSDPVKLGVKSKVTLVTPKRVDSDRGIAFKGKVAAKGAKLGRKGKRLEVQVRVGRRWKAVERSFGTNRKGRYSLVYKFTATYTEPVAYEFRTVVLRERGFPYLPSKSKIRRVVVVP